jgi:hypothetical protein
MWQYRILDLDPATDIDDALKRYARVSCGRFDGSETPSQPVC